jgi:hypothetical protein
VTKVGRSASQLSRRTFVGSAVAAAATGLAVLRSPVSFAAAAGRRGASPLTRSAFTPLLGHSFSLSAPGVKTQAVLDSVADVPGAPSGSPTCFSLLFRAPAGTPLGQATYTVAHGSGATWPLFAVPVDLGRSAQLLQAVINRPA